MPKAIAFYTSNSHLSHYVWLSTNRSLYVCSGIILLNTCIWHNFLPSCFSTLVMNPSEVGVRQRVHKFISRILLLWDYIFYIFLKVLIQWNLSHVSKFTSRLPWLWQLPPSSWMLALGWQVGVNDLESDNRGHDIQWDATSCSACHDLVPTHPFLPPLLHSSFGGLLHTEQQMFFSWY